MSEENKKPEGFSIDDDDIDAMLGIIHHRKDDVPAPKTPAVPKPQNTSASDASKRPAPNGKASAAADEIHASTNAHADENARASANASGHAGADTNNGINPNVISASASVVP